MNPAIIRKFDLLQDSPKLSTCSYQEMGKHPDGGAYISFKSDAEAKRAWDALQNKGPRHQLILATATEAAMIRLLPSLNCSNPA